MTDAWDGRPENPERTGPHELWNLPEHGGLGPTYWTWDADVQCWTLGFYMKHPDDACRAWRYVGPCALPSDLAARDAATREKALREAAKLVSMHVYSIGPEGAYLRPHKDAAIDLHHRTIAAAILALIPQQQEDRTDA